MKFKSIACPTISKGVRYSGKKLVVPNQAMSLQEILERFTRGEPLPIAQPINYHESEDDLEKVSHMDLVDKEEYIDKLKTTQQEYSKQEKNKIKKLNEKLRKEALDKIEAEEKQKRAVPPESSKVIP